MKRRLCLLFVLILFVSSAYAEGHVGEMLVRGGTAVLRISDAALRDCAEEINGVEVPTDDNIAFDDNKIDVDDAWLRETLTDEEYAEFTADYAPALFITEFGIESDMGFVMNTRRIGDTWYVTMRENKPNLNDMWYKCMTVYVSDGIKALQHAAVSLPTERIDTTHFEGREDARYTAGDTQYDVYLGLDAAIVVITQKNIGDDFGDRATLALSDGTEIELTGYRDGNDAIYCCPLTNEEYLLLANHTQQTELMY